MSPFAFVILGFIFGWLSCTFLLTTGRPGILDYPWFLFDAEWRQPKPEDIANALAEQRALAEETSPPSRRRLASLQFGFGITVLVAAIFLILVELLQDFRSAAAAAIEDLLTEPRMATLILASAIGFAARLYRRQIMAGIVTLSQIALVAGDAPKKEDAKTAGGKAKESEEKTAHSYTNTKFPWYVEVGVVLFVVLVTVFWINPQLLRNLTSFKAGNVEAHFATATGSATVQSGLIVAIDPARKTIAQNWANFDYPDAADPRYSTYVQGDEKEVLGSTKVMMDDANQFFLNFVKPIFAFRSRLYDAGSHMNPEIDEYIKKYAVVLSESVLDGGKNKASHLENINNALSKFCKEEYNFFGKDGQCLYPRKIDARTLDRTIWDPYIIQAIADLLLVQDQRRGQEDFLFAAYKGKAGAGICADGCRTAGELSLMYDVVLTKVRSQRPWLFKDSLKGLTDTLDGVDLVLDRNEARWARNQIAHKAEVECLCEKTNSLFRRNRFMDLALGLELFYQRDLRGQHFTAPQMQTWRDWLAETRAVVDTLDDGIVSWPPPFSDDVRKSWLRAKSDIRSRPDVLQDAYVGIALSSVLIGSTDGDVQERECNTARTFLVRADNALQNYFGLAHLDLDDQETYKGFLEQVNTTVDGRCKQ